MKTIKNVQKSDATRQRQYRAMPRMVLSGCLLASSLLVGCASPTKVTVEEQVGSRAMQWADALMAGDYDVALTFMTPSYRGSPRAERFEGDFSGATYWQNAEIKWVKCEEDSAAGIPDSAINSTEVVLADTAASDDCVVDTWNDCGRTFSAPISLSSTSSYVSDQCEVRLIITAMRPPELTFAMPIPYNTTWLFVDGGWYLYRQ